jgi:hypothetical protein
MRSGHRPVLMATSEGPDAPALDDVDLSRELLEAARRISLTRANSIESG